jgi:nitrogen fixation/metabolism regulation signal transduction histidine kinase
MLLPQFGKRSNLKSRHTTGRFEVRLLFSVLAAGLPGTVLALVLLWSHSYSPAHKMEATVLLALLWVGLSFSARDKVVQSVRILSNVVASLKEQNFSFRAMQGRRDDALGELALEINELAAAMEAERRGAIEAERLLRKVASEVEAVILAVSPNGEIKLLNRAAAVFFGKREDQILNKTTEELGIQYLVNGPPSETITRFTAGMEKRWVVRRTYFRQQGVPHRLIMLSEVSEALRAAERSAWQRLVRVLSHEINNSLAPIKSIARTLSRLSEQQIPEAYRENFSHGLEVIGSRADSLNRFLQGYAQLTRIPAISKRTIRLEDLLQRIVSLEHRLAISIAAGPPALVRVDPDQIEQVLINICKNAVDAVLARQGSQLSPASVAISWSVSGKDLQLLVRDNGIGLLDTSNLFVPFYTTKESGTGIGLPLSRQIVEAHGGAFMIRNREDSPGCEVQIKIPQCIVTEPEHEGAGDQAKDAAVRPQPARHKD